jgi:hypothetical protein
MTEHEGPVDSTPWPLDLTSRVVDDAPEGPRIHGYDVRDDLARHFSFAEVVLTTLAGQAPSREVGRAFEIALTFLSPMSIGEAPAHAGSLARLCGARASGVLAVACLALTEQSRALVDAQANLLAWLDKPSGALPSSARAVSDGDRAAVAKLRQAIAPMNAPGLDADPSLDAALLAVLHACGLTTRDGIEAALLVARIGCAAAEGFAVKPASFRDYPMNNPPHRYVGGGA